jgi:CheY-like chemotaxis protein
MERTVTDLVEARSTDARHATRVLIADDNETLTLVMTWALEGSGHEVKACYNGKEAVAEAKAFHPEVVVLDIGMPVMDGLEACRAMRALPDMRDTLIIAQTAWGDAEMHAKILEAGFDVHLVKPAELSKLLQLVASVN